ncbi:hypothetical protein RFM41_03530 [Mesorhizobium sp. VK25A]|uniref:Uncharacterized protein n=1 Tax=Mesorhizobium vachelliae TaxID=3072309 RepID=A0ABU5A4M9_9HYPH|nr:MULTISPECIES: hypothetical protein [unclassified Mesorhizobium]MDX8531459.1 hypothetical protein [Mesorhizobium sp. VK25D]MDX8542790.1 hypothetical protein [Mesorhizobium sp. VK25A]
MVKITLFDLALRLIEKVRRQELATTNILLGRASSLEAIAAKILHVDRAGNTAERTPRNAGRKAYKSSLLIGRIELPSDLQHCFGAKLTSSAFVPMNEPSG